MPVSHAITRIRNWFLQGIAIVAPLFITLALLIWLGRSLEQLFGGMLRHLLPAGWYLPGMGLMTAILLTLTIGLLANLFLVRWLVNWGERIIDRIPLVKTLFQGLKDMARFLTRGKDQALGRPVMVEIQGLRLVGFVMQEEAHLPGDPHDADSDRVAVYLPMSYQMGGYTLYLDRDRITALDVEPEEALRAVLTGGSLCKDTSAPCPIRTDSHPD